MSSERSIDVSSNIPEDQGTGVGGRLPPGERVVYVLPLDSIAPDPAGDRSLISTLRVLWDGRWWIATMSAIVMAATVTYLLLAPKIFRAEVLVVPAAVQSSSVLAGRLGGLGGLASLAGIELGDGNSAEPIATLKSSGFTRAFVQEKNLLPVLFARKWDASRGRWRASDEKDWPDLRDGVRYFEKRILSVEEDKKSGIVTLAVEWSDPDQAAEWANLMIERLNSRMRERALEEASSNLRYLQKQLESSRIVELNEPLGRLVETEMQKLMLAQGRTDFAFRIIDKAVAPKWPTRPKYFRAIALAALLGPMFAMLVVLARNALVTRGEGGSRQPGR